MTKLKHWIVTSDLTLFMLGQFVAWLGAARAVEQKLYLKARIDGYLDCLFEADLIDGDQLEVFRREVADV